MNAQPMQQRGQAEMMVRVQQVVRDHEALAAGIASSQASGGLADFFSELSFTEDPLEAVGMKIAEVQEA
jgi:hypothetical protein